MSPSLTAKNAIPFAQSIMLPPPIATTKSHPFAFANSAPSIAVVVKGFCVTLSKRTLSISESSSDFLTLSYKPDFFALEFPVTMRAFFPYGLLSSPTSLTFPFPNTILTGRKCLNSILLLSYRFAIATTIAFSKISSPTSSCSSVITSGAKNLITFP